MKKSLFAVALTLAVVASPVLAADADAPAAPVTLQKGKMLLAADGARLAAVYRVTDAGPQIILDGRMVTIPADTIKIVDGKATTTLTKNAVIGLR
jgi:hypothetical protein